MSLFSSQDVRFAFRNLQTRPGLSAVIIATLALGIGATTATFSLLDAALLRPLPFLRPDRLVILTGVAGPERSPRGASPIEVRDWAAMNRTLSDVSVFDPMSLNLRTERGADRVSAERVSASYFRLLGVSAALGRVFSAAEDSLPDEHPVALVSHALWRARFGGDSALVGQTLTLNDRAFTIIGVMPKGFSGLSFRADLWVPVAMLSIDSPVSLLTSRNSRWTLAVGRLRDGVSRADAARDLLAVATRLEEQYPESNQDRSVALSSVTQSFLGTNAALFRALFQAVLLVLLIACANVASLLLVRATARQREIALRHALGAGRFQLTRQLLTESMVLALLGGGFGVLLAYWIVSLAVPLAPAGLIPPYARVVVNGRVLGFTLLATTVTGVLCGLAPLVRHRTANVGEALREGVRSAASGLRRLSRPGLQQALVAGEVALALMLLVGAGLMLGTLRERLRVEPGFDASGVLAGRLALPRTQYDSAGRVALMDRLTARLAALPGVSSVAVGSDLPLRGVDNAATILVDLPGATETRHFRHFVSLDYFTTLRIPIHKGRGFLPSDRPGGLQVAVISAPMAQRFWPGLDPIGRTFRRGDASGPQVVIVGVAGPVHYRDLTTDLAVADPDVYYPFTQRTDADIEIAVRGEGGVVPSPALVQREIAALDPGLPLYQAVPLADAQRAQNVSARFGSLVLAGFSGIALLLAAIGIYGVVSFVVGLSRREIAIRVALGADGRRVLRTVMGNGLTLIAAGLAAGMLGARLGGRVLEAQLFGVQATDLPTLLAVSALVLAVAALASWIPARKATRVEPQAALKAE